MLDFRALYYPTRCFIQNCDPYAESQVLQLYDREGTYGARDTDKERQMTSRLVYMPPTLVFVVPFAVLPWELAEISWNILTSASLILAAFLIWNLGAEHGQVTAGFLTAFLLANCELFIIQGMCAGIAISLCAIALWCFFRNRFVVAGISFMAISLALKPQDTGIVWLYFLMAGGIHRKRALGTLLAWLAIAIPSLFWIWKVAPNWIMELRSNVLAFSVHGGINDPGISSSGAHGLSRIISLQSVLSILWDNPHFYNPSALLAVAPFFAVWAYYTVRGRYSTDLAWIALASAAPFAMLPVYHRQYDAVLIILTVPACSLLFSEGGLIRRLAILVNIAGFAAIAELPWAVFLAIANAARLHTTGITEQILKTMIVGIEILTTPLTLFAMGLFYLWVYVLRVRRVNERRGPVTDVPLSLTQDHA
jgi:hypothetical protein